MPDLVHIKNPENKPAIKGWEGKLWLEPGETKPLLRALASLACEQYSWLLVSEIAEEKVEEVKEEPKEEEAEEEAVEEKPKKKPTKKVKK